MSFPMKKFRVFLEKFIFIFKLKISREHLPILVTNRHIFFTLEVFFGGVRNDPMCQKFVLSQISTRVGDTVSQSYSVVNINYK